MWVKIWKYEFNPETHQVRNNSRHIMRTKVRRDGMVVWRLCTRGDRSRDVTLGEILDKLGLAVDANGHYTKAGRHIEERRKLLEDVRDPMRRDAVMLAAQINAGSEAFLPLAKKDQLEVEDAVELLGKIGAYPKVVEWVKERYPE